MDLIRSMLAWAPEERPTAAQCLRHPWIMGRDEPQAKGPSSVPTPSQSFAQQQGLQSLGSRRVKVETRNNLGRRASIRLRYSLGRRPYMRFRYSVGAQNPTP
jgi:hypothetical protein